MPERKHRASRLGLVACLLFSVGLCFLISACSTQSEEDSKQNVDLKVREALTLRIQHDVVADLGTRLTDGQPILHEFPIRNPTNASIRLVNATAWQTCCSSIGPLPKAISAHSEVGVPVVWKAGHQSGRFRVHFQVATDRADCPTIDLALSAQLVPSWEVTPTRKPLGSVANQPGTQAYQVVTRRQGEEALSPPVSIDTALPFQVRLVGSASATRGSGEIVESRQGIEVALEQGSGVGSYAGELSLKWPDGTTRTSPIHWEVLPHVRTVPTNLVVSPSDGLRWYKVIATADDRPFRVLKVTGPAVAASRVLSPDLALNQIVEVEIDPSHLGLPGSSAIKVATDHPDQATLELKVILVASPTETHPMTRSTSRSRGFSLVELLVVIGVLCLLVAIALPAVQAARESARRSQCQNNLHQLALAVHGYHADQNTFPPAITGIRRGYSGGFSIQVRLLPYLEQSLLFNAINFSFDTWPVDTYNTPIDPAQSAANTANITVYQTSIATFLCPSDGLASGPASSYRGNAGVGPGMHTSIELPDSGNGIFPERLMVNASDVTDGLSHTAAFSERLVGAGLVASPNPSRDAFMQPFKLFTADQLIQGCRIAPRLNLPPFVANGSWWFWTGRERTLYTHAQTPNGAVPDCLLAHGVPAEGLMTARSLHPGGVNVLTADGSCRFVTETIAQAVWRGLGTRDGGELVD